MKLNYPTYEQYKESGEGWLGIIPAHWEAKKLKHLFYEKKFTLNPTLNCGSISFGKVVVKDDEKIPESTKRSYQELLEGEYLINPLNLNYDLISLRIALSELNVVVSPGYIIIKNSQKIDRKYFNYLLHRYDVAYMKLLGSGVRQTISFTHIANSLLAHPPLPEQTAIAAFLDKKTSQIEAAIARKERQIALLKEHKQILVHRAVTRGLDPKVPMKNSGVEWIGEVPAHWEVKRLASFGKFSKGGGFSKADLTAEGIPAILYGDIYTRYEISIGTINRFVSYPTGEQSIRIKKGNLLFTGSGETIEDIGKCVLFNSDLEVVAGGDVIIFQQSVNHGLYLSYTLNSEGAKFEKARHSKGEIIVHTYGSKLKNIFIPLPPLEDQTAIAAFLEKKSSQIETAISLKHAEILALKELKTTLINAAVTGKIKV